MTPRRFLGLALAAWMGVAPLSADAAQKLEPLDRQVWSDLEQGRSDSVLKFLSGRAVETLAPQTQLALGWAALISGATVQAETTLRICAQTKHTAPAAYILLGRALERQGRVDDALSAYEQAKTTDYAQAETDLWRARLLDHSGRTNEAWALYARLARVDPRWSGVAARRDELAPQLTRSPDELSPPRRIASPSRLLPGPKPAGPILRISLHSDAKGAPVPMERVEFRCASGFRVLDASNGAELQRGADPSTWTFVMRSGLIELYSPNGKKELSVQGPLIIEKNSETDTLLIHAMEHGLGYAWARRQDQEFRGRLRVSPAQNGLTLINEVAAEDYLLSVLPSEMIAWWPDEALKCQAVISRTNLFYKSRMEKRHATQKFDLCDSQHCQAYNGAGAETPRTRNAVEATAGETLRRAGAWVHALFSSNCGGAVQASGELSGWGQEPYLQYVSDAKPGQTQPASPSGFDDWLRTVPDLYCAPSTETYFAESRWIRIIPQPLISERVNRVKNIGMVTSIRVAARARSGHAKKIVITGKLGTLTIEREHRIRGVLAPGLLRSTFFTVQFIPNGSGSGDFIFWGGGWGHGVGLCQSGAAGRAVAGQKYRAILETYYPGAAVDSARP